MSKEEFDGHIESKAWESRMRIPDSLESAEANFATSARSLAFSALSTVGEVKKSGGSGRVGKEMMTGKFRATALKARSRRDNCISLESTTSCRSAVCQPPKMRTPSRESRSDHSRGTITALKSAGFRR